MHALHRRGRCPAALVALGAVVVSVSPTQADEPIVFDYTAGYQSAQFLSIRADTSAGFRSFNPSAGDALGMPASVAEFYDANPTMAGSFSYDYEQAKTPYYQSGNQAGYPIDSFQHGFTHPASGPGVIYEPSSSLFISQNSFQDVISLGTRPVYGQVIQVQNPSPTTGTIDFLADQSFTSGFTNLPALSSMPVRVTHSTLYSHDTSFLSISDWSGEALPDGDVSLPRTINPRKFPDSVFGLQLTGPASYAVHRDDYADDASYETARDWVNDNVQSVTLVPVGNWRDIWLPGHDPMRLAGTAGRGIAKDREFGSVADGSLGKLMGRDSTDESRGSGFNTHAGQASGKGTVADDGTLSAGAWASGAGGAGDTAGRGIAFMPFTNTSTGSVQVRVNAVLDGSFDDAPFGLPRGMLAAKGNVYVFEADSFAQFIEGHGQALDERFFTIPEDQNGEALVASDLFNMNLLEGMSGVTLLAADSLLISDPGTDGVVHTYDLSTGLFTLASGESVVVLFDVAAQSVVTGTFEHGAGSVDFSNTLTAAPQFFTDASGNIVTLAAGVDVAVVPEPVAGTVLVLLGWQISRRRVRRR